MDKGRSETSEPETQRKFSMRDASIDYLQMRPSKAFSSPIVGNNEHPMQMTASDNRAALSMFLLRCAQLPMSKKIYTEKISTCSWDIESTIVVVSASSIMACDLRKTSDPYVVIKNNSRRIFKGTVAKKTLNPVWPKMGNTAKVISNDPGVLLLEMWDKDMLSKDDFLGQAEIEKSELLYIADVMSGESVIRTYELQLCDRFPKQAVSGSITVRISSVRSDPQDSTDRVMAQLDKNNTIFILLKDSAETECVMSIISMVGTQHGFSAKRIHCTAVKLAKMQRTFRIVVESVTYHSASQNCGHYNGTVSRREYYDAKITLYALFFKTHTEEPCLRISFTYPHGNSNSERETQLLRDSFAEVGINTLRSLSEKKLINQNIKKWVLAVANDDEPTVSNRCRMQ